jgi:regulator of sirC expression with transglutaminase-like and TPR domain
MLNEDRELQAFGDLVRAPEIDLAAAALAIAQIEHPDLSPDVWLSRLDELAARSKAAKAAGVAQALDRLREFLFETEKFRGNVDDYYDPRNSCLNDVLERRLGIPITLSVLTMEIGRRVGLDIVGLGLPGHFCVGAHLDGDLLVLDPFGGGRVLARAEAEAVASRAVGRAVTLTDAHFAPTSKAQIVVRMLRNLEGIYARREDWAKALAVIDRLLVADADAPAHLRDRGTVLVKLGDLHRGASAWERYLTHYPQARDAAAFKEELRRVRQKLAERN